MRISDWSSDVCSSDLNLIGARIVALLDHGHATLDPFVTGATVWMAHHLESRKRPDADRTVRRRMDRVDIWTSQIEQKGRDMADLATQTAITVAAPELDVVGSLAAAAAGGDTAEITPGAFFVLNNGSGVTVTATFATPGTKDGLAIADATMAVLAGDVGIMPLANVFRQSTGRATGPYHALTTDPGDRTSVVQG